MNTNAATFAVDNLSAFDLETFARQIFAACPASVRAMARVSTALEVASVALRAGDADACAVAVESAAAFVFTRSHSAYRAIMTAFEA